MTSELHVESVFGVVSFPFCFSDDILEWCLLAQLQLLTLFLFLCAYFLKVFLFFLRVN